jgi:hypothetical protein
MSEQAAQHTGINNGFTAVVLMSAVPNTEKNMCLDNISNNAHSFWKTQLKVECNVAIQ